VQQMSAEGPTSGVCVNHGRLPTVSRVAAMMADLEYPPIRNRAAPTSHIGGAESPPQTLRTARRTGIHPRGRFGAVQEMNCRMPRGGQHSRALDGGDGAGRNHRSDELRQRSTPASVAYSSIAVSSALEKSRLCSAPGFRRAELRSTRRLVSMRRPGRATPTRAPSARELPARLDDRRDKSWYGGGDHGCAATRWLVPEPKRRSRAALLRRARLDGAPSCHPTTANGRFTSAHPRVIAACATPTSAAADTHAN
jgi:hypothetical protein